MTKRTGPTLVVVDGSNIATEGRSAPSLAQLDEAVRAFMDEFPDVAITVVVDATFGHRIDSSEVAAFDAAVANNELVAPPAGAVGRGDAFVLGIASKAHATILSNDSFQEFHGDHPWLFDEGRLVGGKPVPHVGWVFVARLPVRGPVSRKATRQGKPTDRPTERPTGSRQSPSRPAPPRTVSKEASAPMPVPSTPPPGRVPALAAGSTVNELVPFLEFVERHPVGTSVNAVVETYSSHGAYVRIGDVRGYLPLRLMGDPAPRSAREIVKIGDAITLAVTGFMPARRNIECALPQMAIGAGGPVGEAVAPAAPAKRSRAKQPVEPATVGATANEPVAATDVAKAPVTPARSTKARSAKAAPTKVTPAKAAPTKATPAKAAPTKVAATKGAPAKPPTTKAPADTAPATKSPKKAPAAKAPAKKAPANKAPAAKPPSTKAPATKAVATTTKAATPAKRTAKKPAPAKAAKGAS